MGRIPEEIIGQIREANDIVDIVGEKVKLKRTGSNYMGLCPFHSEKTPSFSVTRQKQIYKCFGCGEGGDVIAFIMKTQNLSFEEALENLANRAGIEIPRTGAVNTGEMEKRERQENMNKAAARFFFDQLKQHLPALEYLKKRRITDRSRTQFGLGFAPDAWDGLLKHLRKLGYKEAELKDSGLFSGTDKGRIYDRFRNRLIFPVFDYRGRVVGFGGRVFDDSKPKYLNSPETLLFKKGTNLYGLNFFIRKRQAQDDFLLVVEGYMDVIALHQAGFHQAVAPLGTALTQQQVRLMKRYVNKVITSFDGDSAGQTATARGLEILEAEGLEVRILQLPDGKDPDEYMAGHGPEAFRNELQGALSLTEFRIRSTARGLDLQKEDDKIKYFERLDPILGAMTAIEKDVWVDRLSQETGVSRQAIADLAKSGYSKEGWYNSQRAIDYVESGHQKAQRQLLKLMALGYDVNLEGLSLAGQVHQEIYNLLVDCPEKNPDLYVTSRLKEPGAIAEWALIQSLDLPEHVEVDRMIQDYVSTIRYYKLRRDKRALLKEIKQLEAAGRLEETLQLTKQLLEIQKQMGGPIHGR